MAYRTEIEQGVDNQFGCTAYTRFFVVVKQVVNIPLAYYLKELFKLNGGKSNS